MNIALGLREQLLAELCWPMVFVIGVGGGIAGAMIGEAVRMFVEWVRNKFKR